MATIKIVFDKNSKEMSFYRMENGRWCIVECSDDDLRPYIREPITIECIDEKFFEALRKALCVKAGESCRVCFEGEWEDFNELKRCFAKNAIELQFIKKQGSSTQNSQEQNEGQTEPEKILEEQIDEDTGFLRVPADSTKWSWRKNFNEACLEEKEVILIRENHVIDEDMVFINKSLILLANVSVSSRIECIHCAIFVAGGGDGAAAGIDVMKNGSIWLKHCTIKNLGMESWGTPNAERKSFLKVFNNGELHIYDSTFQECSVSQGNWLVENEGICHVVDTDFQKCKGVIFRNHAEFRGSWIFTSNFEGTFIEGISSGNYGASQLANCQFEFCMPGSHNNEQECPAMPTFLQFEGTVRCCRFTMQDTSYALGYNTSQIIMHGESKQSSVENCVFRNTGKIKMEDRVRLTSCEFIDCRVLDGMLLDVASTEDCTIENCNFSKCICREILTVTGSQKKKSKFVCTIKGNRFRECISERIIYSTMQNRTARNFAINSNVFLSCSCSEYIEIGENSKTNKEIENDGKNQISKALTSWVQENKDKVVFSQPPVYEKVEMKKGVAIAAGAAAATAAATAATTAATTATGTLLGALAVGNPIGVAAAGGVILARHLAKRKKDKDEKVQGVK